MEKERFEIEPEHLKLIQRFYVGWNYCEFGAPEIDSKRPYGNSNVHRDMIKILGIEELKEGVYKFKLFGKEWLLKGEDKYNIYLDGADEKTLIKKLDKLHKETETTLQICLDTQTFQTGIFEREKYSGKWAKI